jgi:hypothetical protein
MNGSETLTTINSWYRSNNLAYMEVDCPCYRVSVFVMLVEDRRLWLEDEPVCRWHEHMAPRIVYFDISAIPRLVVKPGKIG